jgi:hypothetical protein
MPIIKTKTITELAGVDFFVPSYQRGYRWTSSEVVALLDDLQEFADDNGKRKYCLQPLVVKPLGGKYEVVDGQQRLTTIFIFIKLAAAMIPSLVPPYTLAYETRPGSSEFLNALTEDTPVDSSNIDFHHITTAFKTMIAWCDRQPNRVTAVLRMYEKVSDHTFFIWYELPGESDAISMFAKINLGRIPLTNAELIKALIMSRENFGDSANKQQIEISTAWDRIEQALHDNSFWYFLNQADNTETRIDLLFELLAHEYNTIAGVDADDKLFPFLVFSQIQKSEDMRGKVWKDAAKPISYAENVWSDVEALYSEFRSWYADLDKYHMIGFLTACGVNVQDIRKATVGLRKSKAREKLLDLTKKTVGHIDWENLTYGRGKVRNILLLFNIATLVNNGQKQYRFPFDLYKKGKWDIEHIHAIKDDLPNAAVDCHDYLASLQSEFEKLENDEVEKKDEKIEVAQKIKTFLCGKAATDLNFRSECVDFYNLLKEQCADLQEDNDIRNLTLLNADINRGYQNVTFMQKRCEIIAYEGRGWFIPLCTKNVFLKYYASDPTSRRWSEQDREEYAKSMQEIVNEFWGVEKND